MSNVTTVTLPEQRAAVARSKAQRLQAAYQAAIAEYREYDAATLRQQCEAAEREAEQHERMCA